MQGIHTSDRTPSPPSTHYRTVRSAFPPDADQTCRREPRSDRRRHSSASFDDDIDVAVSEWPGDGCGCVARCRLRGCVAAWSDMRQMCGIVPWYPPHDMTPAQWQVAANARAAWQPRAGCIHTTDTHACRCTIPKDTPTNTFIQCTYKYASACTTHTSTPVHTRLFASLHTRRYAHSCPHQLPHPCPHRCHIGTQLYSMCPCRL